MLLVVLCSVKSRLSLPRSHLKLSNVLLRPAVFIPSVDSREVSIPPIAENQYFYVTMTEDGTDAILFCNSFDHKQ
jgi:hypothetical protein